LKIAKHESEIARLTAEIATTEDNIALNKKTRREMRAERKEANEKYNKEKQDDHTAVATLNDALNALSRFYQDNDIDTETGVNDSTDLKNKHNEGFTNEKTVTAAEDGVSFIQKDDPVFDVHEDTAPGAELSGDGVNAGQSKGVVALLNTIIKNLEVEMAEDAKLEAEADALYVEQRKQLEAEHDALEKQKTSLEASKAAETQAKTDETNLKTANEAQHKEATEYLADLKAGVPTGTNSDDNKSKGQCDWLLANFEKRAEHRRAEMDGLETAKSYLAGMALVQTSNSGFLSRK